MKTYLSASLLSYFPTFSPFSRHFCHCLLLMHYSDIYLHIPCFIFQTYTIPPGVSAFSAGWMARHSFLAWCSSIKFLLLNATFPNSDKQNNQCETKKTIRFSPEYSVAFKKGKCMIFFKCLWFLLPKSQPFHREYKVIYVWAQLSFKLYIHAGWIFGLYSGWLFLKSPNSPVLPYSYQKGRKNNGLWSTPSKCFGKERWLDQPICGPSLAWCKGVRGFDVGMWRGVGLPWDVEDSRG